MIINLKPDFVYEDERGMLVQLVHTGWSQINIMRSKAGITRGGHYHKECCEAFYVINGCVCLTVEKKSDRTEETFQTGDFFLVEPGCSHSMFFPKDSVLLALYDKTVERPDGTKDIFPCEKRR